MFTPTKEKKGNGKLAKTHTAVTPAKYVALDIETGHASDEVIKAAVARWTPPSNMKDEAKIEERRKEAAEKIKTKSALLDASPITCIAVRTEKIGFVFNAMDKKKYTLDAVEVVSCGDERTMLIAFREWLDASTYDETVLVGFNLLSFDLPKLRCAYVRHRLKLPKVIDPHFLDDKQPAIDLMRQFRYFSSERNDEFFTSMAEVLDRFGIDDYKSDISGADIPDMVAAKKFKDVLVYSAIEGLATWRIFTLMNSTAPELE